VGNVFRSTTAAFKMPSVLSQTTYPRLQTHEQGHAASFIDKCRLSAHRRLVLRIVLAIHTLQLTTSG
jgi:hypothetical protein